MTEAALRELRISDGRPESGGCRLPQSGSPTAKDAAGYSLRTVTLTGAVRQIRWSATSAR